MGFRDLFGKKAKDKDRDAEPDPIADLVLGKLKVCGHELRLVRRVLHGVDDVLVAGAATEVAVQPVPDFLLGR